MWNDKSRIKRVYKKGRNAIMRICQNCKTKNVEESIFCRKCGTKIEDNPYICPDCLFENTDDSAFCIKCGTKLGVVVSNAVVEPVVPERSVEPVASVETVEPVQQAAAFDYNT